MPIDHVTLALEEVQGVLDARIEKVYDILGMVRRGELDVVEAGDVERQLRTLQRWSAFCIRRRGHIRMKPIEKALKILQNSDKLLAKYGIK